MRLLNACKSILDDYPVYNPIEDFKFDSGKSFQRGCFPIDSSKINIGIAGRGCSGKSALINAFRGLSFGDLYAAGRYPCEKMEPFTFVEEELRETILWEIPYPRTFTNVADIYDRSMGFDRYYDAHKLHLFELIFVLISDGNLHDDDIAFSKVVHSRRTPLILLSTKTDNDLDAESRETNQEINERLKEIYVERARNVFAKILHQKAQVLADVEMLYVSAPVIKDQLNGNTSYLHYKIDEDRLLELVGLKPGCHYALENSHRKQPVSGRRLHDGAQFRSTILADAGFEISYATDDRVFGNCDPRCTVRRAGKTAFNYGFVGGAGTGKSALINAIRGMSNRHPLAAGRSRAKPALCERFEFDDDLLAYTVTLWEMHYPKKISAFFEYIDQYQLANFTAVFILINGVPSDEDLAFAKIAFRRNATIVFLLSKCDKILMARSRSDEIPVCDLLKQRFVDKGIVRFDRALASNAPELCGRVHLFFVSARVFKALRLGEGDASIFLLHERAVFDFLKQKRMIAEMLESPNDELKEGLYANVNEDTPPSPIPNLV
ncbi:unnamed protein product [Toxocara canis]|uniref:IRG-type G domain-containing protein n=1 Tax=Toxocara canis TaxID=6265 RepID=A0A183V0Z5_TOXCA|nr:unnamed protein product [Toxocara canis]